MKQWCHNAIKFLGLFFLIEWQIKLIITLNLHAFHYSLEVKAISCYETQQFGHGCAAPIPCKLNLYSLVASLLISNMEACLEATFVPFPCWAICSNKIALQQDNGA